MKRTLALAILIVGLSLVTACATYRDMKDVHEEVDRKTSVLDENLSSIKDSLAELRSYAQKEAAQQKDAQTTLKGGLDNLQKSMAAQQTAKDRADKSRDEKIESLEKGYQGIVAILKNQPEIFANLATLSNYIEQLKTAAAEQQRLAEKSAADLAALRKTQADMTADVTELKDGLQHLRGTDEELQRGIYQAAERNRRLQDDLTALQKKTDELTAKISQWEKTMAGDDAVASSDKSPRPATDAAAAADAAYKTAYEMFKAGQYEKARGAFQAFLKQFATSNLADNAQFWLAETFFQEKHFEEAVLEYEKLATNYPESDKMAVARLKQALSFWELGDKESARVLLQQVVNDYPNSNQARYARNKLKELD
ncbi:MAG: tol-pal system protein YbgF [Smithellaceae bacterium]|nr:tol-pal system protein YbgF [Smithellaceae bacterium]